MTAAVGGCAAFGGDGGSLSFGCDLEVSGGWWWACVIQSVLRCWSAPHTLFPTPFPPVPMHQNRGERGAGRAEGCAYASKLVTRSMQRTVVAVGYGRADMGTGRKPEERCNAHMRPKVAFLTGRQQIGVFGGLHEREYVAT